MKDENQKTNTELSVRLRTFALRIIKLYTFLPKTPEAQVIGKQFLRSGTSVGAHYRESIRARSNSELVAKIDLSLQELEETNYWIELLIGAEIITKDRLENLLDEINQLLSILTVISKKIKIKTK